MKKATFECKVITPMFMFGGDGGSVELRPSEFKGMMRFWWRAVKAEDDIKKLREEEAKLFGGTGEGEGRSRVRIRVTPNIPDNSWIGKYQPLPHSETKRFQFSCIREGLEFSVVISARRKIEFYKNIFIPSCILGGFGKRSRRGFGAIEILELNQKINLHYIRNLLASIDGEKFSIENSKLVNKSPGKGNYPWIREIEIGRKGYHNMKDILKKIGNASHKFRDPSLGNAKPRMASPIYVSVIKDGDVYKPIVVTLNSWFPSSYPKWDFEKQNKFRKEILYG